MRKYSRILALALAAALLLSIPTLAWKAEPQDLTDVEVTFDESVDPAKNGNQPSAWAKPEVEAALAAGLVPQLTGNPKYTDAITREQFAELVVRTAQVVYGKNIEMTAAAFTDCDNPAVRQAASAGIVEGVGDGKFDPKTTTNREQIAAMVARSVHYLEGQMGREFTKKGGDLAQFTDRAQVSDWAADSFGLLSKNGILMGTSDTTLSPKASCTVEQSILLLYHLYKMAK